MIAAIEQPPVETRRPRRLGRSIVAVLAGLLTIVALDVGIDTVLHAAGVYPPFGQVMSDGLFLVALAYRAVDAVLGTYVAGRLAPRHPRRHTLMLGAIGLVLGSLGVLATLSGGPELGPIWYPLALVVITLPCAWIGGTLAQRSGGQRTD
jgi:MFS family permease